MEQKTISLDAKKARLKKLKEIWGNEQMAMAQLEVNLDFLTYLTLSEPSVQEYAKSLSTTKKEISFKEKYISIIEKKIDSLNETK